MTIVKYIVEAHGGTAQVDSKYREGTTVKFSVPIKEGKMKKILIVDDKQDRQLRGDRYIAYANSKE